jgi:hypothetical protein
MAEPVVVEAALAVVRATDPTTVPVELPIDRVASAAVAVAVATAAEATAVTVPTGEGGAFIGVVGELSGTFGRDAGALGADGTPTGAAGGIVGVAGTFAAGVVTPGGFTGAVGGDTGIVGALGADGTDGVAAGTLGTNGVETGVETEGAGGVMLGPGSPAAAWPVATSAITAVAMAMLSARISAAEIPTSLSRAFLHEMRTNPYGS